jgi:hypothetical protein
VVETILVHTPKKKHPEHPVKVLQDLHRVFKRESRPNGQTAAAAAAAAAVRVMTKAKPNIFPNQTRISLGGKSNDF